MKYILTEEEFDNLCSIDDLKKEETKIEILLIEFKKNGYCKNPSGSNYCDDCPIALLNNEESIKICDRESYSK